MIILKQVIHDKKTNSVEATWVDVITPAIEVPESIEPDMTDKDGNIIPGKVTPAHTIDAVEKQVKCHSYADVQMQMFRDDIAQFGGDIKDYELMIAEVEAAIVPPPPPTETEIIAYLTNVVQQHLDNIAKSYGYDSIISACTYATDTNTKFKAEGQACVNWRGAVWGACYSIMVDVQAGNRAVPTADSLIADLPVIAWPV